MRKCIVLFLIGMYLIHPLSFAQSVGTDSLNNHLLTTKIIPASSDCANVLPKDSLIKHAVKGADSLIDVQTVCSDSLTIEDLKALGVMFAARNEVVLLPDGAEKFKDMFAAIEQARRYVYLEYFNFRNDSIGNALFQLLRRKVKQGVKVRVIYDDFGNVSNDRPLRKRKLRNIEGRGVAIQVFDPVVFPIDFQIGKIQHNIRLSFSRLIPAPSCTGKGTVRNAFYTAC